MLYKRLKGYNCTVRVERAYVTTASKARHEVNAKTPLQRSLAVLWPSSAFLSLDGVVQLSSVALRFILDETLAI